MSSPEISPALWQALRADACGALVAYGLLHLVGDDGAEFMAVFTHGELESLDPIVESVGDTYRCLGRGAGLVVTGADAMGRAVQRTCFSPDLLVRYQ